MVELDANTQRVNGDVCVRHSCVPIEIFVCVERFHQMKIAYIRMKRERETGLKILRNDYHKSDFARNRSEGQAKNVLQLASSVRSASLSGCPRPGPQLGVAEVRVPVPRRRVNLVDVRVAVELVRTRLGVPEAPEIDLE